MRLHKNPTANIAGSTTEKTEAKCRLILFYRRKIPSVRQRFADRKPRGAIGTPADKLLFRHAAKSSTGIAYRKTHARRHGILSNFILA